VLSVIVLWNTIYMDAVLNQLRAEGFPCGMTTWHDYRHSFMNTSICFGVQDPYYQLVTRFEDTLNLSRYDD
jgi:hypothetical protein